MVSSEWIEKQKIRFDCMGMWHFNVGRDMPLRDADAQIIPFGEDLIAIHSVEQEEYDIIPIIDELAEYGINVETIDYQILCSDLRGCSCQ